MSYPKIVSVGTFLPGPPIMNQTVQQYLGIDADWLALITGNTSRHYALDLSTGEIHYTLEDMATRAALQALEKAGLDPDEIDLVIMSSATPDALMPATVNRVVDRLGINSVPTYELQSGCTGATQGLGLARQFLLEGHLHNALVIGADTCTKFMDMSRDFSEFSATELMNYAIFGDGAGAAILSTEDHLEGVSVLSTVNRCEGLGRAPGQEVNYYGTVPKDPEEQALMENYKAIEAYVPRMASETLEELLAHQGWTRDDITLFMPPQPARLISEQIAEQLNLPPEKCLLCVGETGNSGNALPYLQLDIMMDRLEAGERAVGFAIESSKWIKGGILLEKEL